MSDIHPPRRYSVGDADYDPAIGARLEVFLDGVARGEVVAYDIDARTLTRHATDEQGNVIIDRAVNALKCETLTGDVAVVWKESPR